MTRRQRIEDLTTLALPGEDDATHWQRRLAMRHLLTHTTRSAPRCPTATPATCWRAG
jgi:hypothetical protein